MRLPMRIGLPQVSRARLVRILVATVALLSVVASRGAAQSDKIFRVGILSNVPISSPQGAPVWGAFVEGLRDLGYVEGKNLTIVDRSSEGRYERLPELAAELVRLKVDVIVVPATQNVRAAQQASRTIPIVMAGASNPVEDGLVASLARPGGNVTGLSMIGERMAGKQLELLKETVPGVARAAVLGNPANARFDGWVREAKEAARALGMDLVAVEARGPDDFERAFGLMKRERVAGVVVSADGMYLLHPARIAALAAKHRLPAIYGVREFVDAGGLMTYSPSMRASFRRAATYVDRIFKGAKAGDLPVEQAAKFDLIINLKAARALGLAIPPPVLARATEVVQ
jgi:putative ABC transport system substrate-binding protein